MKPKIPTQEAILKPINWANLNAPIRAQTLTDVSCFVKYWHHIDNLRSETGRRDDSLLNPLHFLATTDKTRRSCAVACWHDEKLIGLLYATEHILAGIATGYAVGGNYSGRGLLLCKSEFEASVIQASIEHMASQGIHSLHLRLQPRDSATPVVARMAIKCLEGLIPGDRLLLPSDFTQFLATLGKHTRRNIRHYMRKTAQEGIEFAPSLTLEEYRAGVKHLNGKSIFQANRSRLARDERLLTLHSNAQRFGLRAADGNLVALLCGFTQGKSFHLLTQLNDPRLQHLSLSLALRGYTAEHLIASGYTDLQFLGGASLSLGRFCVPQNYRSIFADKKKGIAAAAKWLATLMPRIISEHLTTICNGKLPEVELIHRTALGPAALVFREEKAIGARGGT